MNIHEIIKTGPDRLDTDLASQIDNLDPPEKRNTKEPISKVTLESLRKLANGIIIEKPRNYEKFRD